MVRQGRRLVEAERPKGPGSAPNLDGSRCATGPAETGRAGLGPAFVGKTAKGRVAEGPVSQPPPPSSNRTCGFSASGFPEFSQSQACTAVSGRSFTTGADQGHVQGGHSTSGPVGLGTDADFDDAGYSAIVQAHTSSACRSTSGDGRAGITTPAFQEAVNLGDQFHSLTMRVFYGCRSTGIVRLATLRSSRSAAGFRHGKCRRCHGGGSMVD